jgi:3-oxoadipate enol-lactonase
MPHAAANGMDFYYEDTGGEGPALVFSHGLLMDREMFAPQIEVLRATHRCISWDQRGFGRTGPVREPFSYWTSANDVLSLMSALNVDRASLVGLSQGGFLSMRAALLAPDRVSSLVLLATRSGIDTSETIENFRGLQAEWASNGSTNMAETLTGVLLGPGVDPAAWIAKWRAMGRADMAHPLDALISRDDITSKLKDLACHSLVIHGNADIAIDIEHGRRLAHDLPGCRNFCEIDAAGHAVNLARPEEVSAAIALFLASLD